jgi:hypothetical protein
LKANHDTSSKNIPIDSRRRSLRSGAAVRSVGVGVIGAGGRGMFVMTAYGVRSKNSICFESNNGCEMNDFQ